MFGSNFVKGVLLVIVLLLIWYVGIPLVLGTAMVGVGIVFLIAEILACLIVIALVCKSLGWIGSKL